MRDNDPEDVESNLHQRSRLQCFGDGTYSAGRRLRKVTKTEHKTKLLILPKLQFAAEMILQPEMMNANHHANPHSQF